MADTKVVVVFAGNDMVPHVATREAHQRSLKFSCFTRKGLFQHYRHKTDIAARADDVSSLGQSRHCGCERRDL